MKKYVNGEYIEMTQEEIDELLANMPVTPREELIANSKTALAEYLATHPLTWMDGKQYNVTAEKQALLTSQLSLYAMASQAGVQTDLHWNATGEECQVWQYADLCALAMAIGAYVQPLVSKQQAYETAVLTAETDKIANEIVLKFA